MCSSINCPMYVSHHRITVRLDAPGYREVAFTIYLCDRHFALADEIEFSPATIENIIRHFDGIVPRICGYTYEEM